MKRVSTGKAPKAIGLLSQAIISNGFVYTSGQVHVSPDNTLVGETTEEKTHQVMKNLEAILQAAGVGFSEVVKATVYVTDLSLMPKLNAVYPEYFSDPLPAREAVCVKKLPLGADLEISVIAEIPH